MWAYLCHYNIFFPFTLLSLGSFWPYVPKSDFYLPFCTPETLASAVFKFNYNFRDRFRFHEECHNCPQSAQVTLLSSTSSENSVSDQLLFHFARTPALFPCSQQRNLWLNISSALAILKCIRSHCSFVEKQYISKHPVDTAKAHTLRVT